MLMSVPAKRQPARLNPVVLASAARATQCGPAGGLPEPLGRITWVKKHGLFDQDLVKSLDVVYR